MDLDKLFTELPDDVEIDLGGERGKIKGAELKTFFSGTRSQLSERDQRLQQNQQEIARLKKYEEDTSALFAAAARMPSDQPARQEPAVNPNDYDPMNDPLLGEPFKKYHERYGKKIREEVAGEFTPLIGELRTRNDAVTRALFDERQERQFRDAGEWPEGWSLQKAREYAKEKGYWQPNGGAQWGLADIGRIHGEVTEPIRRAKWEEDTKKNAREEAIRSLRAEGATISIPQRSMGGGGKPVQVKGKNGEEIISSALAQAGQDMETMRMLEGLRN